MTDLTIIKHNGTQMTALATRDTDPTLYTDIIDRKVQAGVLAPSTGYKYSREIEKAIAAGVDLTSPNQLTDYTLTLKVSSRNFFKYALSMVYDHLNKLGQSQVTLDTLPHLLVARERMEATLNSIELPTPKQGQTVGTWLTRGQVIELAEMPDMTTLSGLRDKVVLALLVGCGLRRNELAKLTWGHIKKDGDRWVIDLAHKATPNGRIIAKGAKGRQVSLKASVKTLLDTWHGRTGGGDGDPVILSVKKGERLGGKVSGTTIYRIVNYYGRKLGIEELAPHDLRRTYAKLLYGAGVRVSVISGFLGHSSTKVTERYLGIGNNEHYEICDFIPGF